MLRLVPTSQYKRDRRRLKKQGKDLTLLDDVISKLQKREPLARKHRDHLLSGNFAKLRECHVASDWLFIYAVDNDRLILTATRTGSHAELF